MHAEMQESNRFLNPFLLRYDVLSEFGISRVGWLLTKLEGRRWMKKKCEKGDAIHSTSYHANVCYALLLGSSHALI